MFKNNLSPTILSHHKKAPEKKHINDLVRSHCVSVRLNNFELSKLNTLRGNHAKGEWLRMASLQKLPTIVPTVNIDTWKTLGEINQKLYRIALHIDSKSEDSKLTHTELFAVKRLIKVNRHG